MIRHYEDIGEMGKDILKEISSIGTGNAATSMSKLMGMDVKILLPDVKILSFSDAVYSVGEPEEQVIAVMSNMSGEMSGVMLFIFRQDFANILSKVMMGKELDSLDEIDEITASAVAEAGNIVVSSYIGAMSTLTGMDVKLSVPAVTVNMLGGVLNVPMVQVGYETDKLLMISGKFIVSDEQLECCLMMVPDMNSLNSLLMKLEGTSE